VLEHFFKCPYCWETVSMLLDTSVFKQSYIEDCEVCCNLMQLQVVFEELNLISFIASDIEQ